MKIIWAQQDYPERSKGIFLAGPTFRELWQLCNDCHGTGISAVEYSCLACLGIGRIRQYSWRLEAIDILRKAGYQGEIYVPEPEDCRSFSSSQLDGYEKQIKWEREGLERAHVILFWIPRDLNILPGFTTNIEFGEYHNSGKCVVGYPPKTPKMGYIKYCCSSSKIPQGTTIQDTCTLALERFNE